MNKNSVSDGSKCAPGVYNNNYTCIDYDYLVKIAESINKHIKKLGRSDFISISSDKKSLFDNIKTTIDKYSKSDDKNQQFKWTSLAILDELNDKTAKSINQFFRPEGPSNSHEWLASDDITDELKLYEKTFPDFFYIDTVPNDYVTCSAYPENKPELLASLKSQISNHHKSKFGIVFNLDNYGQPGSHWVACFFSIPDNSIFFYDSTGEKPTPEIQAFIDLINKHFFNNSCVFKFNNVPQQKGDTECGVFSLTFIIKMLHGTSFNDFIHSKIISDSSVFKLRKTLFN